MPLPSADGLFCKTVRLPEGWASDVAILFDRQGMIRHVEAGVRAAGLPTAQGPVIPGMPNLHSHAFQRALAGRTYRAEAGTPSFWSWRTLMYAFVQRFNPEQFEAVAARLYLDLLQEGYTAVGEFHYVHHDQSGRPYADPAELSHRHVRAASQVGIGLTLLPVFYRYSDFGGVPALPEQRRFVHSITSYSAVLSSLSRTYAETPDLRIGIAPHSLRAVSPDDLSDLLLLRADFDAHAPFHLHIAEQLREVEASLAWSGQRPVSWLFDHAPVADTWCLIHATHMTREETQTLAKSKAVAGLCPTTEADLGDGIFPIRPFLEAEGVFGIGSDSHVSVSPAEELRLLEYEQRLHLKRRNVLHRPGEPSTGAGLYLEALRGGAQALGRPLGRIAPGCRADFVVLNEDHPLLFEKEADEYLDTFIFSGGKSLVRDVFVGGKCLISDGRHALEEPINRQYRRALRRGINQM